MGCDTGDHGSGRSLSATYGAMSEWSKEHAIRENKIRRVFAENFGVYGLRRLWRLLRREGEGPSTLVSKCCCPS